VGLANKWPLSVECSSAADSAASASKRRPRVSGHQWPAGPDACGGGAATIAIVHSRVQSPAIWPSQGPAGPSGPSPPARRPQRKRVPDLRSRGASSGPPLSEQRRPEATSVARSGAHTVCRLNCLCLAQWARGERPRVGPRAHQTDATGGNATSPRPAGPQPKHNGPMLAGRQLCVGCAPKRKARTLRSDSAASPPNA